MLQNYAIALGGGLAAALLFAACASGSLESAALLYVAPLPLMLVTLGWGLIYGAFSAGAAIAGVALIVNPVSAAFYAVLLTLPALLLSLGAARPPGAFVQRLFPLSEARRPSLGAVLTFAALLSACVGLAILACVVSYFDGFQGAKDALDSAIAGVLKDAIDKGLELPPEFDAAALASAWVKVFPALTAAGMTLMFSVNLYLAGRLVHLSQLQPLRWRDVANGLLLPPWLAGVLALTALLGYYLPGAIGGGALIIAGALTMAFLLQGLAVLHAMTRGFILRPAMIAAVYFAILIITRTAFATLVGLGAIESFLHFRARLAAQGPNSA